MALLAALLLAFCADDRANVIALLEAGRQRDAADVMARMLEEQPENDGLRSDLVQVEMRIGRYAAALAHCEKLGAHFDPTRGKALYLLGRYEEALEFLKSDSRESILFRHESLWVLARFEEAAKALEQAAKLLGVDHVEVRVRRGQAFAQDEEFEKAASEFRYALERDPLSAAALYGLGRALIVQDKLAEGMALLEQHRVLTPLLDAVDFARMNLELDLSHAPNHAALGDALRALIELNPQLIEEARGAYATAAQLAEGLAVVPIALRHARFLEEHLKDPAQAVAVLEAAYTRRSSARLLVRAGDIWMRASRAREALSQYQRAQALRPQDGAITSRIQVAQAALEERKQ